jgi:hypothetical protein
MMIPADLLEKYGLPYDMSARAVEIGVTRALTRALRAPVMAVFAEEGLAVYLLSRGVQEQISLAGLSRKTKALMLDCIELELMKRSSAMEALEIGTLRGSMVTGRVEGLLINGALKVRTEINHGFRTRTYVCECPVFRQPRHERLGYKTNIVMPFIVESCLPVTDGNRAWVRIVVSRTARSLPALLLTELTGISGIKCLRRLPGAKSELVTRKVIPKSAINAVGKGLKEHLHVVVLPQP